MPPFEITTVTPEPPERSNVPPSQPLVPSNLNIDPHRDTYVIRGGAGVAVAHVRKPDGQVFSARVQANGALQQFTSFDSNALSVPERRNLEHQLYTQSRMRQTEIADLLGVSQATVANDLKILRDEGNQ
jgi:predicted transcriptional regulator